MEVSNKEKAEIVVSEKEEKAKIVISKTGEPVAFTDMDAVFERVGGNGRYTIFTMLAISLVHCFGTSIALSPVFTTAQMPVNCTEHDGARTLDVAAGSGDAVFDETAPSRFGLVCDRAALANLPTTCYFLGLLFGCSIYGSLADRIGRLRVVQLSMLNMSLCIIGASQAPFLWLYCLLQMLAGFGDGGINSSTMTYLVESTDTKHRGLWALSLYHGCTLGTMMFTLIAYCLRSYQHQLLCIGACSLAFTMVLMLLTESPRWLASVGRFDDADRSMRRIDRLNNGRRHRRLPASFSTEAVVARGRQLRASTSPGGDFRDLLCQASLRPRTLLVWLLLFTCSVAFFGVALGVGRLGGDIFVNQLASAAVEPPSRLLCAFASLRMGRRPSICGSYGLAGACLLVAAVLVDFPALVSWRVAVAMMGKFWIVMAFDITFLYATELFPTRLRSAGVGSGSSMSRAGGLVSSLFPALGTVWAPLPFLLFAVGPLAVAVGAPWFMPETRGRHLADIELTDADKPGGDCDEVVAMTTVVAGGNDDGRLDQSECPQNGHSTNDAAV